ncbi:MAG: hypothetical protein JJT94_02470 [Bernardetiaceae bacterium]|nr:hypothetical protein [Bernardetiaceae bacterium]
MLNKYFCFLILSLSLLFLVQSVDAYPPKYTDYRPDYRKWKDNYILDKIEYTDSRTIFFFRFVAEYLSGTASFYGPGAEFAWLLKNKDNPSQVFDLIEIKNIRKNGNMLKPTLNSNTSETYSSTRGDVFTCEVHFATLPAIVTHADLIEGRGKERDENHFNCFNIRLKTFESDDLGTVGDMRQIIEQFEETNRVPASNAGIIPNSEIAEVEESPTEDVLDIDPELGADAEFARKFVELLNEFRAEECYCGGRYFPPAPPIEWSEDVAMASKSLVMVLKEKDAMTSDTDGKGHFKRLEKRKLKPNIAHENISYRFETIEEAFNGWKRVPPQCMRMRDPRIKKVGAATLGKYWSLLMISE